MDIRINKWRLYFILVKFPFQSLKQMFQPWNNSFYRNISFYVKQKTKKKNFIPYLNSEKHSNVGHNFPINKRLFYSFCKKDYIKKAEKSVKKRNHIQISQLPRWTDRKKKQMMNNNEQCNISEYLLVLLSTLGS